MAAPTVTVSLDKPTYAPGEKMTLTVNYADADTKAITLTVVATDSAGNTSAPTTVTAVIDPVGLTVTSSPVRAWTKVSDTGSVAVFTATA